LIFKFLKTGTGGYVKGKSDNCPTLLQTLTPEQLVATDGVYVCSQNGAGLRTTSPNLFFMNCNGSSQSLLEEVVWIDRYTLHTLFLVSSTLGNLCPHSQICFSSLALPLTVTMPNF